MLGGTEEVWCAGHTLSGARRRPVRRPKGKTVNQDTFALRPLPPFRLDLTVWVLRRRPENAMDRWDEQTYRRVLVLDGTPVAVAVRQVGTADAPRLEVATIGGPPAPALRSAVAAALDRLLGLDQDMTAFDAFAGADDLLRPLVGRFRGFKPPRFPSVFECLANAIACQQITLTLGIRVLNRLTEAYGLALDTPGGTAYAFPRPQELAAADPDALRRLGFSTQKARSLIELAGAVASGRLDLEALAMLDDAAALARLLPLRGVGRWTAEYALLRGLGRLHIFPGDDVGARNNLQRWLALAAPLDYDGVHRVLGARDRFGGLMYFSLLLNSLAAKGILS